jgi:hypothetical protein
LNWRSEVKAISTRQFWHNGQPLHSGPVDQFSGRSQLRLEEFKNLLYKRFMSRRRHRETQSA